MRAVSGTLSGEQTVILLISKLKFLSEITEIHYQYCTFVDSKRFEDLVNLFAKNATIGYGPNLKCQGHTDISALFKQLRLSCENTSHHISNIQTRLSKDQVCAILRCNRELEVARQERRKLDLFLMKKQRRR